MSGIKWSSVSTVIVTLLQLGTLVLLARFLGPEDFGLMAILSVVVGFSQVFMDMGISQAIIHRQDSNHSQLSSLYWLNVAAGLALSVIVYLAAPLISTFYDRPDMAEMIRTLSVVFVIIALGNQYRVLCQKELQFKLMARAEISAALASFVIAVMCALSGFGVYALIYSLMAQSIVLSLMFLIIGLRHHHRPSLQYKHKELKGYFSFGLYQMGDRCMNYLNANADNLLIGKFLTMEALGYYSLAWQLCIFPVIKINPVLNKVAFPVFAKLQKNPLQLNDFYTAFICGVCVFMIPLMTFLFYFSYPAVELVYGEGWQLTAVLVPILAGVGIVKAIGAPGGSLFLALGRADVGFWWNAVWLAAVTSTVLAILTLIPTIQNVAYGLLVLNIIFAFIWHSLILRLTNMQYRTIISKALRIALASFAIGCVSYFVTSSINFDSAILYLLVGGLICLILYIPYLFYFERNLVKFWKDIKEA